MALEQVTSDLLQDGLSTLSCRPDETLQNAAILETTQLGLFSPEFAECCGVCFVLGRGTVIDKAVDILRVDHETDDHAALGVLVWPCSANVP